MSHCVAVCCSVSQCLAVCRSVLQCVAVCCSVSQCVAVRCSVLQRCCSVLQCVAVRCTVLQRCCSVLQHHTSHPLDTANRTSPVVKKKKIEISQNWTFYLSGAGMNIDVAHCSTLQYTAAYCKKLQHTSPLCTMYETPCNTYGMASISRLLEMRGLFCRI